MFVNPRRACAARVTVLGSVCVCVCVCQSVNYGASVRPENAATYSAGNEGQNICGDLPETTAFKSYAAKHERKSQLLIIPTYRCQLSPLDTQRRARGYPTIVNNIQPCPKLCLLMPLARVGARTNSRHARVPEVYINVYKRSYLTKLLIQRVWGKKLCVYSPSAQNSKALNDKQKPRR